MYISSSSTVVYTIFLSVGPLGSGSLAPSGGPHVLEKSKMVGLAGSSAVEFSTGVHHAGGGLPSSPANSKSSRECSKASLSLRMSLFLGSDIEGMEFYNNKAGEEVI